MSDRLDDGVGAQGGIAGLEDAAADKDSIHPQLHHQRGVGRGGDATGGKVDHRQAAQLRRLDHQVVGCANIAGIRHQFLRGHRRQPADLS